MEAKPAQMRNRHVTLFIPFPMAAECALRLPVRHPGSEGAGSLVAGPGVPGTGGAGGRRRWGGISCTNYKQQQRESGTSGGTAGSRPGRTPTFSARPGRAAAYQLGTGGAQPVRPEGGPRAPRPLPTGSLGLVVGLRWPVGEGRGSGGRRPQARKRIPEPAGGGGGGGGSGGGGCAGVPYPAECHWPPREGRVTQTSASLFPGTTGEAGRGGAGLF